MATAQEQGFDGDQRFASFALKDYEMKVNWTTSHLQRMWTRFNYFVIIEAALIGGKTVFGEGELSIGGIAFGLGLSLLWYVMGAEDRYLFVFYRDEAKRAGELVANSSGWRPYPFDGEVTQVKDHSSYNSVGNVPDLAGWRSPFDWRHPWISTTRMAALIPFIVSITWIVLLLGALK